MNLNQATRRISDYLLVHENEALLFVVVLSILIGALGSLASLSFHHISPGP